MSQRQFPSTAVDAVATIKAAAKNGKKIVVRSGAAAKKEDEVTDVNTVGINLAKLNKVTVDKEKSNSSTSVFITVEAGATCRAVYDAVCAPSSGIGAIISLPMKKSKSIGSTIASALQKEKDGVFPFLGKSLGPLSTYIKSLSVVDTATGAFEEISSASPVPIATQFNAARHTILSAELEAPLATNDSTRVATLTIPFSRATALCILQKLRSVSADLKSSPIDIVVEFYYGAFSVPSVFIAAIANNNTNAQGKKNAHNSNLVAIVQSLLPDAFVELPATLTDPRDRETFLRNFTPQTAVGVAALAAIFTEDVLETSFDCTVENTFTKSNDATDSALNQFLDTFQQIDAKSKSSATPNAHSNGLRVYVTAAGALAFRQKVEAKGQYSTSEPLDLTLRPIVGCPNKKEVVYTRTCNNKWLAKAVSGNHIPNFKGKCFNAMDADYRSATHQYASSSYALEHTSPFIVAYPTDIADIFAVLRYAEAKKKYVVARSGGHQYSAKSSGNVDTIVVSLDTPAFEFIRQFTAPNDNFVEVGPGTKLQDISGIFLKLGMTIPHGECPFVCIGGHAQTGGFGHLIRLYGLAMDRVHSFDLVLSDGRLVTVTRPAATPDGAKPDADDAVTPPKDPQSPYTPLSKKDNRDLFRCVLSGNAGSYGIVTRYVLNCIRDSEAPKSEMYQHGALYESQLFRNLLRYCGELTRKIKAGTDKNALGITMTVVTKGPAFWKFNCLRDAILVEGTSGGALENPFEELNKVVLNTGGVFRRLLRKVEEAGSVIALPNGKMSLSKINRAYVRMPGKLTGTSNDGREFDLPYKKRLSISYGAMTEEFIEDFVNIVDKVLAEGKVCLVYQMSMGGGAFRANGRQHAYGEPITGIPHREYIFGFIFDIFYPKGEESTAIRYQREMDVVVHKHFGEQDRGVFWASYANTDISRPEVRDKYYDSPAQYSKFQQLKRKFDGKNMFHTDLTVQQPIDMRSKV